MSKILDTIEADLGAAGGWLEDEAQSTAAAVWADLGGVFRNFMAAELAIVTATAKQMIAEIGADPLMLLTPDAMATELLNRLAGQEAGLLATITPAAAAAIVGGLGL